MGGKSTTASRIAGRQHGVVTRTQLRDAGVTRRQIDRGIANGRLLEVRRGVYRVGHAAPSYDSLFMAAVLACGSGALVSHYAAAHLHRLIRRAPRRIDVTARSKHRIPGIHTHRSKHLHATKVRDIPATTVPRTIVDLSAELDPSALARLFHEATVLHRTTPAHVEAVLTGLPNAKGATTLRWVLHGDEPTILSRLEAMFLALLTQHGFPLPITNRKTDAHYVDCRWPAHRLTVELDSFLAHNDRYAWERDRAREREAYARGDQFRRYTWRDVVEEPAAMLVELRGLLGI